ncbi:hypothetical protein DFH07DRAFT_949331 [Mycena maculata]|uniref:Uncharacterized protein n=1 Tax=Mycena maculata TaxID=230809 RepID=A0AAD7P0C9_9AGAR|nr:hypothetical protein DFH07DRAFT_949331 [Mycena maculata]
MASDMSDDRDQAEENRSRCLPTLHHDDEQGISFVFASNWTTCSLTSRGQRLMITAPDYLLHLRPKVPPIHTTNSVFIFIMTSPRDLALRPHFLDFNNHWRGINTISRMNHPSLLLRGAVNSDWARSVGFRVLLHVAPIPFDSPADNQHFHVLEGQRSIGLPDCRPPRLGDAPCLIVGLFKLVAGGASGSRTGKQEDYMRAAPASPVNRDSASSFFLPLDSDDTWPILHDVISQSQSVFDRWTLSSKSEGKEGEVNGRGMDTRRERKE